MDPPLLPATSPYAVPMVFLRPGISCKGIPGARIAAEVVSSQQAGALQPLRLGSCLYSKAELRFLTLAHPTLRVGNSR